MLEMGEPVRIMDLAEDMIRFSGLEPGRDIAIEIIGRRPGEKLSEDLFNAYERPEATPAQKILRARRAGRRPRLGGARRFDRIGLLVLEGDAAALAATVAELSTRPRGPDRRRRGSRPGGRASSPTTASSCLAAGQPRRLLRADSMVQFLAFSLQDQVEKYGAYIGIAAFFGLAVLTILYFSQARELRRLRDWAGRAPERARRDRGPRRGPGRGRAPRAGRADPPAGRRRRRDRRRPPPPRAVRRRRDRGGRAGDAGRRARQEQAANGTAAAAGGRRRGRRGEEPRRAATTPRRRRGRRRRSGRRRRRDARRRPRTETGRPTARRRGRRDAEAEVAGGAERRQPTRRRRRGDAGAARPTWREPAEAGPKPATGRETPGGPSGGARPSGAAAPVGGARAAGAAANGRRPPAGDPGRARAARDAAAPPRPRARRAAAPAQPLRHPAAAPARPAPRARRAVRGIALARAPRSSASALGVLVRRRWSRCSRPASSAAATTTTPPAPNTTADRPSTGATRRAQEAPLTPAATKVTVLNGTTIPGLASHREGQAVRGGLHRRDHHGQQHRPAAGRLLRALWHALRRPHAGARGRAEAGHRRRAAARRATRATSGRTPTSS